MKKNMILAAVSAMAVIIATAMSFGAAATANVDTPERAGEVVGLTQASNHIYAGSIVALSTSTGKVQPAGDTSGLRVVGRSNAESDNTGSLYSASKVATVGRGVFRWSNGSAFTDADIGSLAYVLDDQTVVSATAATNDIVAGIIVDVDSDGVWVDTYAIGGQGAASFTTFNASGNGAILGTLAVTKTLSTSSNLTVTANATVGGTLGVTGVATFSAAPAFSATPLAASTNALGPSVLITLNGTNVWLRTYLPNN